MDLREAMERLAALRQDESAAARAVAEAKAVRDATIEGQAVAALEAKLRSLGELAKDAKLRADDLAMALFRQTGDKHPAPGATIKLFQRVRYDAALVRAWCWTEAPTLVVLDTAAFDKLAEGLIARGAPAEIVPDPRPQIARDLSAYLVATSEPTGEG